MREEVIKNITSKLKAKLSSFGYWSYKFEQHEDLPNFSDMSDNEILNLFEYLIRQEAVH